jgi:hypothetical protein
VSIFVQCLFLAFYCLRVLIRAIVIGRLIVWAMS